MNGILSSIFYTLCLITSPPGDILEEEYCVIAGPDETDAEVEARMEETLYEEELIFTAINHCKNATPSKVKPDLIRDLLEIEKNAGVPKKYRGMVLAAACSESGYNPNAVGDSGKAVGILQMWPWWERSRYKVNRRDPHQSAMAWTAQIMRTVPKAIKKCGKRQGFLTAWSWVAAGPKKWRCRSPRHYTRLKRWQRRVKKELGT